MSQGGLGGPRSRTPGSPRTRSVPVETYKMHVPSAGSIWSEGPPQVRRPCEGKGASGGSPTIQAPQGSKGASFPVTFAPGGGPPHASREGGKNTANKRGRKFCPRGEGRRGPHEPQLGVRREGGTGTRSLPGAPSPSASAASLNLLLFRLCRWGRRQAWTPPPSAAGLSGGCSLRETEASRTASRSRGRRGW